MKDGAASGFAADFKTTLKRKQKVTAIAYAENTLALPFVPLMHAAAGRGSRPFI